MDDDKGQYLGREIQLGRVRAIYWILLFGLPISGIIPAVIIGAVVYLAIAGGDVPEVLGNWGGIILGFYFGTLFGLA